MSVKNDRRNFLIKTGLAGFGLAGMGLMGPRHTNKPGYDVDWAATTGDLRLVDWEPVPQLVVKKTTVVKPKFPVIDIHNHLGRELNRMDEYLQAMDEAGVWKVVSLDGRSANDFYKTHLEACQQASKNRLIVFFTPDFSRIDEPDYGRKESVKLEHAVELGCRGLKIFLSLGLRVKDQSEQLVSIDDPRIDPIWAKCGELGIPVLIHSGAPKAFFKPLDRYNERYDELSANPGWVFYGDEFPSQKEILQARNNIVERHPNTIFIGAHVANLPEELGRVSMWLDKYPNLYVEIGARISELGRQPYTTRRFMNNYQDRILFGSDTRPNVKAYQVHYRFLETEDEYIDADPSHHRQGRWRIYGLHLPDEVLEKIYYKNALKIFGMFKGN